MLQFITHSNEKYDYLTSAIEALKAATELEQAFKAQEKQQREAQQKHTVPVNIPEDVTPKM